MGLELFRDVAMNQAPSYAAVTKLQHWSELPAAAGKDLLAQLQTTLELQEQLDIFSMAAGKVMPLMGIQLNTAAGEYHAAGSGSALYEHRSVLVLQQQCLAEIVYRSNCIFTPMLKRELLLLESDWLFALRNALVVTRLQQMALKDNLTSLGNRRFFDDCLHKATTLAKRHNEDCALLLLDLDNFKQVNDHYGHHTGDEVLLAVADAMRDTLRETDNLFRFGGDEFAVILTDHDSENAELVASRLIKAINQHHICQQYQVTASLGLARLKQVNELSQLFRLADQALYAAKHAGKNQLKTAQR
ncbi:GGDEF domain-containing protein [Chromatiaceae bacterium AAb-1]|nr:GGDEF domain-containing protein [Chromatiaceae bacterium AAb-1]